MSEKKVNANHSSKMPYFLLLISYYYQLKLNEEALIDK